MSRARRRLSLGVYGEEQTAPCRSPINRRPVERCVVDGDHEAHPDHVTKWTSTMGALLAVAATSAADAARNLAIFVWW